MDILAIPLWAQRGGGGEWIYLIVFLIIVVFNAFKAMFEARFAEAAEKKKREAAKESSSEFEDTFTESRPSAAQRERRRTPRQRSQHAGVSENPSEERKVKSPLSRELGEQGVGARFEADPGTLDTSHLVAPSIEPTVKPTLESMTGIYEAAPTVSELGDQPLTLDIQRLIARPEGIRQAVILAEILKRPEF